MPPPGNPQLVVRLLLLILATGGLHLQRFLRAVTALVNICKVCPLHFSLLLLMPQVPAIGYQVLKSRVEDLNVGIVPFLVVLVVAQDTSGVPPFKAVRRSFTQTHCHLLLQLATVKGI